VYVSRWWIFDGATLMLIRLALICSLLLILSGGNAYAQDECSPVRGYDGYWHLPGEIWNDLSGMHAVPDCNPWTAKLDSARNARALCNSMLIAIYDECHISGSDHVINLRMTLPPPQRVCGEDPQDPKKCALHPFAVNQFCSGATSRQYNMGIVFETGWQVKLYSPYSGDRAIATCDLPTSPAYSTPSYYVAPRRG
jgi:hypothetical protein